MPMAPSTPTGDNLIAQSDPSANYMGPDKGPFKCGHCEYFMAPNACQKVQGPIDAEGCCNLYEMNDSGPMPPTSTSMGGLQKAALSTSGVAPRR